MVEADCDSALADPLVPRHWLGCFDRDALDPGWQHAVAICLILLRKQLHARHAHGARANPLLRERVLCLQNDRYLGSACHQHHFRIATPNVGQYVRTARDIARSGVSGPVDEWKLLSREYQTHRRSELERCTPRFRRFVGIGRADDGHVRDRSQIGQLLDWLVRRAIFTKSNRIVRVNVDETLAHHARESHWRAHVVAEYQERRAVRDYAAVERHSVHDAAHAVLAYSEMEVAALVTSRPEARRALHYRVGRAGEIRRASDQLRDLRCNRVDNRAGSGSRCDVSGFRVERRYQIFPAILEEATRASLEFSAQIRVRRLPLFIERVPRSLFVCTGESRASPECERVGIHIERLLRRNPEVLLGELDFLDAEWRSVCGRGVLLVRTAVADVRAHDDERRTLGLCLCAFDGLVQRIQILHVADELHVPAVPFETEPRVVAEREIGVAFDSYVIV